MCVGEKIGKMPSSATPSKWDWSPQQEAAIADILDWHGGVYRCFGFAGTGKTTIIKHLCSVLGRSIRVAAFTGKAAQVLQDKGILASTIHSMIYRSAADAYLELCELRERLQQTKVRAERQQLAAQIYKLEEYLKDPKFELNPDAFWEGEPELIILDEVSMINEELGKDLLSFKIPVLTFGDTGQLPPVEGQPFFMQQQPDVMLTEVHRQALGNPIIKLATDVRLGNRLRRGMYGESEVTERWPKRWWENYDQLLVGRNIEKDRRNQEARRGLGFKDALPMVGERLICLRNNRREGLLNGSQWIVEAVDSDLKSEYVNLKLKSLQGMQRVVECTAWKEIFIRGYTDFKKKKPVYHDRTWSNEFDFAYAMTVHKAQGSEWDRVLLKDESYCWRRAEEDTADKWLYTGITRAVKKLTIVQ